MNDHKAFSLVEISVVIVIVGILVAGISKGVDLYQDFKLATARNLTINSRVNRISDLVFWVEATSENSFTKDQTYDGAQLSQWNDINPRAINKNNLIVTASSNIIFKRNSIASLPTVYFNGGVNYFNSLYNIISSGNFSFFAVYKNQGVTSGESIIRSVVSYNGFYYRNNSVTDSSPNKMNFGYGATPNAIFTVADLTNQPEIFSAIYNKDATIKTRGYLNYTSTEFVSDANYDITYVSPQQLFRVGASWIGDIAEIVIFNRALDESERLDVEKYLSKKWSIILNR